ncbi:hypothetical protein B0H16DRAFT_1463455 [Mycena metata]|uniref:Uncharacterized protein n=1 Tax=Mycena metata TaxID=1033252 RepID=A0AAD7N3C3_9AGAR|nr:hypothetical protein B0H16DRAFT_1463455 [Mycena metata]
MATLEAERTRATTSNDQILALSNALDHVLVLESEGSLSTSQNQRTPVQEPVDPSHYPVLTLPNEIVGEIFTRFLPVYCTKLSGGNGHGNGPPVALPIFWWVTVTVRAVASKLS